MTDTRGTLEDIAKLASDCCRDMQNGLTNRITPFDNEHRRAFIVLSRIGEVARSRLDADNGALKGPVSDAEWRDLIVDYLRRGPVSLSNVASHFGMSQDYALSALLALQVEGRASRGRGYRWEAVNAE